MALFLGVDLGTSYFKVGLFDEAGVLKGLGRVGVTKTVPAPGRSELAVGEFWRLLRRGLREALAQARARPNQIAGLSYSSQASTFVLLDEADEPLTPLVFWTDTRGAPVGKRLERFGHTSRFCQTVGFEGLSEYAAPGKWRWFSRNRPAIWARTRRIMTISDYFTFALTGERVGDASTAAFLGIYDLPRRRWWAEGLAFFGIDPEKLSTPLRPGSPSGRTRSAAVRLLGVPAGIPFAVGGLDHHVAAIGSGLGRLADMSISTGTVLAALSLVDRPTPRRNCYHGLHVDGVRYFRLAFDPAGAGQLEDYQRRFAPDRSFEQLLALAEGAAVGIGPTRPPKLNRADVGHGQAMLQLMNRIASTQKKLVRQVAGRGRVRRIVATGGGARSPLWLQIKADTLGVPVVTPSSAERACLGAAVFAAVAAGRYRSIAAAALAMIHPDKIFRPGKRAGVRRAAATRQRRRKGS